MMLPVSSFKGQPVGRVTTTLPWLTLSNDPAPQWLWLARWSAAAYQAMPPLVLCHPTVWIPQHTHLIQWECPAAEVIPLLPPFYYSSLLHHHNCLPKLFEGWMSPEEVVMFQRRDKHLLPTNPIIERPGVHAPRTHLLLSPFQLTGHVTRGTTKTKAGHPSPSLSSSSSSSSPSLHLLSLSPPFIAPAPTGGDTGTLTWTGGADSERAGLHTLREKGVWPLVLSNEQHRQTWLHPIISLESRRSPSAQMMKQDYPSIFTSRCSSRLTLVTDYIHKKQRMSGGRLSYEGALLLRRERTLENDTQCVCVNRGKEGKERGRIDKRPVASTPVPGSPWCVVWTGDDQVFFFNPTIHLSVWERPGDLIGRDISHIIEDPPHKRKKTHADGSYLSSGLHGDDDDDDEHEHSSKKNRVEEPMSLVPCPGEVQLLPLELRVTHFREMMLERGVSAFSTWEKELHKMVFDPRYLLLTSDQRKQVFDQFVKSRVKEEYKEKKSKQQKAREEFKQLLEEAKISHRSTFKDFCARYRGDQRFSALNRKKEQEMLFSHYMTSLKKRDKENRARLRKMR